MADRIDRELLAAARAEARRARKTKLRAGAETPDGFTKDVLVSVIANVATKPIGP